MGTAAVKACMINCRAVGRGTISAAEGTAVSAAAADADSTAEDVVFEDEVEATLKDGAWCFVLPPLPRDIHPIRFLT